jgi:hypothetical protein
MSKTVLSLSGACFLPLLLPVSSIVNASASAPAFKFVLVLVIVVIVNIDGEAPALSPRHKLVPADDALATLIPAHAQAPPKILRYTAIPPSLTYRAIDSVDMFPSLIRSYLGKISGS